MNEGVRNQLEEKLKKMLDQAEAKEKKPKIPSGTGNIIRRRAGEKEKRFLSPYIPDVDSGDGDRAGLNNRRQA